MAIGANMASYGRFTRAGTVKLCRGWADFRDIFGFPSRKCVRMHDSNASGLIFWKNGRPDLWLYVGGTKAGPAVRVAVSFGGAPMDTKPSEAWSCPAGWGRADRFKICNGVS